MSTNKRPLTEEPTPVEAPPSYDQIHPNSPPTVSRDRKSLSNLAENPNITLPEAANPSTSYINSPGASSSYKGKGKAKGGWFDFFGPSKTAREVKVTVAGLIRDIVKELDSQTPASLALLENCAESCTAQDVDISTILQDPFIEKRTPLYWAIIKRGNPDDFQFITALLSYATPLKPATASEIRLACLQLNDQVLFHNIWRLPEYSRISGVDEMLLGASLPPDSVEVEDPPSDDGAFVARFEIVQFQKRMLISKKIELQFITRGRIWWLRFDVLDPRQAIGFRRAIGTWIASISILEHSTPTWLDARLVISDPLSSDPDGKTDPKEDIAFRLQQKYRKMAPLYRQTDDCHFMFPTYQVFDDVKGASSLQYADCGYYTHDGTLRATLEARLVQPESPEGCTIC